MGRPILLLMLVLAPAAHSAEWRRPFVSDVFFYWYTWDRQTELGSWMGGVHFTPLDGYYDSRTFADNRHSLWLASEWGMTDHFIDYWTPTWKGEDGEMREKTVFRAAESLRKDGYGIHMAYYQDGESFAMDEFSKNVSEKRDVHQWLRDFARSPLWPRVGARQRPWQLVYSRNGSPKLTATNEGFRSWLRERYKTTEALNQAWGMDLKSFDAARLDFGLGRARADSIRYQYLVWQREWQKLDGLVAKEFSPILPGVFASFDIGYAPFRGFSRSDYFRVFGGPHSYAGIFAQPHEQEADRFLCSVLAKQYDTVFLDHLKHCYHDWNIRVPGMAYLHEPHHFDRFWVGDLMRFNEGVLHLSWNEWWEGSNLEPSMETGKTYCEKNLFYSTLMQRCFPSIRDWGQSAPIALILNDWHLLTAEWKDDDLFAAVQSLRRVGARFDILPEESVTAEALAKFQLVVAPGCDTGFSENARGEPIHDLLLAWCRGGGKLWASANPRLAEAAGLKPPPTPEAAERGRDFNLFIDVGAEGDEKCLLAGASQREDWGKLPEGKFGAGTHLTVRWTPATGTATRFLLPAAPQRDHVLRVGGSAIYANTVDILVDNALAGTVAIQPGLGEYELPIPRKLIGGRQVATITFRYAEACIPKERSPKEYPDEGRACNLAMDWLQWSTSNTAKGDKRTTYEPPKLTFRVTDPLFEAFGKKLGEVLTPNALRLTPLAAPGSRALSVQDPGGIGRDILVPFSRGELLYVNGRFSDADSLAYWHALLDRWAKLPPARSIVATEEVMSARLDAEDTAFLFAYNEDIAKKEQRLLLRLPVRDVPLSEAMVLSRDGQTYLPLEARTENGFIVAENRPRYYGVYQFAFSPVRVTLPKLEVCQGEKATVRATVENLTDKSVDGTIRVACVVPTLGGPATRARLGPREAKEIELTIESGKLCDWGTKTVTLELDFDGHRAVLFRPCLVLRRPDVQLAGRIIVPTWGKIRLVNRPSPHAVNATAEDVRVSLGRTQASISRLESGKEAQVEFAPRAESVAQPQLRPVTLGLSCRIGSGTRVTEQRSGYLAVCPETYDAPTDAVQPLVVYNARDTWLDHFLISRPTRDPARSYVRTAEGRVAPWMPGSNGPGRDTVCVAATVPPRSARVFFLCVGDPPRATPSPLRLRRQDLGTGRGRVTVSTPLMEVTFDESKGGTITGLLSKRTGRQYAAESFGAAYGEFGRYDPASPATTTPQFVRPSLKRQAECPATITVDAGVSPRVHIEVAWTHGPCAARQEYWFVPWNEGFLIHASGKLTEAPEGSELVVTDARFRAEHFAKTFPDFVGMVNDHEQPHFGWRRGTWVPERLTFMHPPDFTESLSIIALESAGVSRIRQGFWPQDRPKPGKMAYAWAEYITEPSQPEARLALDVSLHRGYHLQARQRRTDLLDLMPSVSMPEKFAWGRRFKPIDVDFPKDWFSPEWQARLAATVQGEKGRVAVGVKPLAEKLGARPKTFRCVQVNEENDLAEREFEVSQDGDQLFVDFDPRWGRTLHVYGSTEELPSPLLLAVRSQGIGPESFENPAAGWDFGGQALGKVGREGAMGVRLRVTEGGEPAVISNGAVMVTPESSYRLTFWARTSTPGAFARTNFFAGPEYDFHQEQVDLDPDGKWRRYETTVQAGKFPPSVQPVFRLWALGQPQTVEIDDLELRPIAPGPVRAVQAIKVDRLW